MKASKNNVLDEVINLLSKEEEVLYTSVKALDSAGATEAARVRMVQLNQTSELKNKIQGLRGKEK